MADLSAPAILAIGTTGAVIIGAFFTGLSSFLREWRAISGKVYAIEAHVNSEKTAAEGRLAAKDIEIALLRERVNDLRTAAGLLAQAQAIRQHEKETTVQPVEVVNVPLEIKVPDDHST